MAAFPPPRAGSRSSLFNGHGSSEQELPSGSCNYRDLSIGARAPLCGCQKFYLNVGQHGHDLGPERAWCFCGHHACFHNAFSQQRRTQEQNTGASVPAVEERETMRGYEDWHQDADRRQNSSTNKGTDGLGIRADSRSHSQSINNRVWQALNDFARHQDDGVLSDTTSKLPSTAAPSVIEETRLTPTRVASQLHPSYRAMPPPVNIPQALAPRGPEEDKDYSATEVATPSIAGTPDFRALAAAAPDRVIRSPSQLQISPAEVRMQRTHHGLVNDAQILESTLARCDKSAAPTEAPSSLLDLQDMMRTYSHRLEALESLSFSHVPFEEIQERFELFDGRLLDLEQWRVERDQERPSPHLPDASRSKRRRLLPDETASFASDASFDSNAAAHAEAAVLATIAANAETHPRIDALESRVVDLENAALPSFTRPWQVQVVLLPWSRELRGIWFSAHEAMQHSLRSTTQASEEWTGAETAPRLSFKSVDGAWTTESIEAWADEAQEWLSPKACGPNGAVFQRLASRGLVQIVALTALDARHVMSSVVDAFKPVWHPPSKVAAELNSQGLSEPFIPLRKIRKSSRLRFLSPAELVTSASWTAGFLDASVFMKTNAGQRRLYITTSEAYAQPHDAQPLTWSYIRELPVHPAMATLNPASGACWAYHENLDHPFSVHSSFASQESQWSAHSRSVGQAPLSPSSERHVQPHRTVSLPSSMSATTRQQETVPERRVASFGATVEKHHYEDHADAEVIAKRRRISLSPEAERRGVNFTPRWSREPPSPFTSEGAIESKSQGNSSRPRGTTPFAYATPHSNSNYIGRVDLVPGDGDTEVATDMMGAASDHGEEEWEGVDDDNMDEEGNRSDDESIDDEAASDEHTHA